MKDRLTCTIFFLSALVFVGCSSLSSRQKIVVQGEITHELEMTILPFHPPYLDHHLLVRVTSPENMKGEVISLSIQNGWGRKAKSYGKKADWEVKRGLIEFEVDPRDIQTRPDEPRRINVDRILLRMPAEQGRYGATPMITSVL